MSKDINYKKFDLSEIQWNKIKGGITKEEFCKGDKRLERIFDALDNDNVKGRLSGSELRAFSEALEILAKDDILDKKEARQFRDVNNKKLNSKNVFEFLEQLKELQNKNIVSTQPAFIDGREVELTEYPDGRKEEVSLDGKWRSETFPTPRGSVKKIYENGIHTKTITKAGVFTKIKDLKNDTETEIVDLGNGLQNKTIKERIDLYTTRYTHIYHDNTKIITEYKNVGQKLRMITTSQNDEPKTYKYEGFLETPNNTFIDINFIEQYINGSNSYDYMTPDIIKTIINSPIDPANQKRYLSGIINRTIRDSSEMEGYSPENLRIEFDKFLNDNLEDVTSLETLYKDAAEQIKVIYNSGLNGRIDNDFEQGNVGDCYLLSVIKSLSLNPETLKELDECINIDSNGNARVTLKGVGKTYTITQTELDNPIYSSGDQDVRAIEIAVEKYLKQYGDPFDSSDFTLRGGFEKSAFFLLTGKHAFEHSGKINDKTIDAFMRKNTLACAAILSPDKKTGTINFNSNAENIELTLGTYHSYTVAGADENNVYLINPWNTVIPITLTREEFKKYFNFVTILSV